MLSIILSLCDDLYIVIFINPDLNVHSLLGLLSTLILSALVYGNCFLLWDSGLQIGIIFFLLLCPLRGNFRCNLVIGLLESQGV